MHILYSSKVQTLLIVQVLIQNFFTKVKSLKALKYISLNL